MSRRDNGLTAASYAPLADVDPPLAEHVLEILRDAGVAAYAEPLAGETGPYRDVRPPDRPTTRVYVDRIAGSRAREVVGRMLPGLRADFLADVAARADRRDVAQSEVDAAWAQIVAGFDTTAASGPVPPWPVAEDVDRDRPDGDDTDGSPGPAATGLAGRLVRRGGPAGAQQDADETEDDLLAEAEPDDPTDHYVPPHPPPLPRPRDTVSRFAWAGAVGGPVLLVLAHVLGLDPWIGGAGVAAFVAGFVTLVARMQDRRPHDDGWDDGAVV